ncbi:hypothetical protein [Bradyrhizobium canariense]|uniref:Uncharacterized protein n=1 Tax=Bradyrhizobium canariense TaxID=255045 RepID=A0A1H1YJM0_9BRAD|nr:hypothetical protein [Bradyrhizobium canariense]SDT21612.1 hypothetical protein SAMN05444158_4850 [Bradyrhizobium canariense]
MTKISDNTRSKFDRCGDKPLFYPDDDGYVRELISELIERRRYVRRESKFHLKHREVNYFYTTRVITIDGKGRHPETGEDAFLELLEQLYPRRGRKPDPLSQRDQDAPPSSLVLDISLDSEGVFNACAGRHGEDSEDDLAP